MDVGAPSNYERIKAMYTLEDVRNMFASYWLDNDGIKTSISECNDKTGYTIDPHGAIAWKAWDAIRNSDMEKLISGQKNDWEKPGLTPNVPSWGNEVLNKKAVGIILETAHPAKFGQIVKDATGREPVIPSRLAEIMELPDRAIPIENDYNLFKDWLIANLQK